uniref:HMG box domain-containing protein n=1 Tax=Ditylenchus dipsaci TaxID=166011 RepID=A0A915E0M8_9BILA
MIECLECYGLSNPIIFSSLEELEIHLTNDHFKLNIYECAYCPYAKFPTETTLVDHYNTIHKITANIQVKYTLDPTSIESRRRIRQILNRSAIHVKQELICAQEVRDSSSPICVSESNHSSGCELITDETNDEETWVIHREDHRQTIKQEIDLFQSIRPPLQAISTQEAAAVVNAIAQVSPVNRQCQQMPELGLESTSEISTSPQSDSASWDLPAPPMLPPVMPPVHVDVSGFAATVCSRQTRLNFVPLPKKTPIKSNDKIKKRASSKTRDISMRSPSRDNDRWLVLGDTPDHRKSDRRNGFHHCKKRGRPKGYKVIKPIVSADTTSNTTAKTTPIRNSLISIGKKGRKVRLARDKGMPPRPISAFLHFSNAHRAIIREKSLAQGVSYRELAKQMWEGLENKGYWKSKEVDDCTRYKAAKVAKKAKEVV